MGPLTVSGSTAGAELSGNTISGPVNVTRNAGTAPGADQGGLEVESNRVSGSLSCSANSSASDDGAPNTVTGPATGQCAGLVH
jgi:5'-nucleotidase